DLKHLTAHHLGDEREASRPGNRQCITEIVDTSVRTGAHHYARLSQRLQLLLDPRVVTQVVRIGECDDLPPTVQDAEVLGPVGAVVPTKADQTDSMVLCTQPPGQFDRPVSGPVVRKND